MPAPHRVPWKRIVACVVISVLVLGGLIGREYWLIRRTSFIQPSANLAPPSRAVAVARPATTTSRDAALSSLDLAGDWTIKTPRGRRSLAVTIHPLASRRYRLSGPGSTVFDGDYEVRGDSLAMVASGTSYHGFIWRVTAWGWSGKPIALALLTTDYAGAMLTLGAPQ